MSKIYGTGDATVYALRDIDMRINRGEFVAFMGASGSGKSTALNVLGCLDVPTKGEYLFGGIPTSSLDRDKRALLRRHYLGFVFQSFNLLPRTSALENVELPLIYRGVRRGHRRRLAMAALGEVGLADRARHAPSELSGGQQQRVAIARAIVTEPQVLLADEPTGNVDSTMSHDIMQLLARLNSERDITIVLVTHELDMAGYADRTVHFRDGYVDIEEAAA